MRVCFLLQVDVALSTSVQGVGTGTCELFRLASSYLKLCVSGRPLRAGAPVWERGEGAGENAQLGGKAWPALSRGSPREWLYESHPTQQGSPVSGEDRFF